MGIPSLAQRLWYQFCKSVVKLALVLFFRVRYTGRENIPAEGAVLVVSNHQSHLDPPTIGAGFPRIMNYLARETLFDFKPFGWLIGSVGAIPIDQEGTALSAIKATLKCLKRGEVVLIFPEGSRTEDGELGPFRPGFTAVARRAEAAILPVAIEGAYQAWPRWRRFPRPGTIHVHYGPLILSEQVKQSDETILLQEVETRIRGCQAALRGHAPFTDHSA